MDNTSTKWVYLIALSLVWGSSFILMKYALVGLSPVQVGALRIIVTGVVLMAFTFKSIFSLTKNNWKYIVISAVLGTFFPVFLFAYAIKNIDSSIAAILNSFTPFNALLIGALFFGFMFRKKQVLGIMVGLVGTILLIVNGNSVDLQQNYYYSGFILLASVGYAINVNIIKKYLNEVDPIAITTGTFVVLLIPALYKLVDSQFFTSFELTPATSKSLLFIVILSVIGTAIAKIFFNKLVQISSPIFSTSVTYLIPIVAVIWGLIDGERLTVNQILSGVVILFGVYLMNRK